MGLDNDLTVFQKTVLGLNRICSRIFKTIGKVLHFIMALLGGEPNQNKKSMSSDCG